jgi:hypothetical protein
VTAPAIIQEARNVVLWLLRADTQQEQIDELHKLLARARFERDRYRAELGRCREVGRAKVDELQERLRVQGVEHARVVEDLERIGGLR